MKRSIISKYNNLSEKLTGYVAMMNYRFLNLCVKAEEVALLPCDVTIEGETVNFEEAAKAAKKNDYQFMVFPIYEEDLVAVGKSITEVHPEFKQEIEELSVESYDEQGKPQEQQVKYILITMPDVDDNRYDALNNAAKVIYEECKAQMEAANSKSEADLAPLIVGESEEDIDKLKKAIDKLNNEKNELRDQLYNEKKQEIKDAYKRWLSSYAKAEVENLEMEDSRGANVVTSMRMTNNNEDSN